MLLTASLLVVETIIISISIVQIPIEGSVVQMYFTMCAKYSVYELFLGEGADGI